MLLSKVFCRPSVIVTRTFKSFYRKIELVIHIALNSLDLYSDTKGDSNKCTIKLYKPLQRLFVLLNKSWLSKRTSFMLNQFSNFKDLKNFLFYKLHTEYLLW